MNKTKVKIANAFLILLEFKKDDEITNNEIIEQAGISKGTFYNNFTNKQHIASFIFHEIDSQIIESLVNQHDALVKQNSLDAIIKAVAENTIPVIYDNRERIKILYKSSLSGEWQKFLEKKYLKFICETNRDMERDNPKLRLIVKYALDIISLWITSPIPTQPDKFKPEFYQLFKVPVLDII